MFGFSRSLVVAVTCALTAGPAIWLTPPARAEFVMTVLQSGSDVVMAGSGTIDTTDLTDYDWTSGYPELVPDQGVAMLGPQFGVVSIYTGANGFLNFGTTSGFLSFGSNGWEGADIGSGSSVGVYPGIVYVPIGYASDSQLSGAATFDDATFASLGIIPGIYTDTWGSGADADSFVLEIGPIDAPEPAGALLLAVPLAVLGFFARGRRPAL